MRNSFLRMRGLRIRFICLRICIRYILSSTRWSTIHSDLITNAQTC